MKIKKFEIFQYQLPLNRILHIKNHAINIRTGFLIILADQEGYNGIGEISPLPGLHHENNDHNLEILKICKQNIINREIPPNFEKLDGGFIEWLEQYNLSPSVQFGIESAVLNLLADKYNIPLYSLLSNRYHKNIYINALLSCHDPHIYEKCRKLIARNFQSIKIKVGTTPELSLSGIDQEIKIINNINKLIKKKCYLRLDANQAWDLEQAVYFINSIDRENIEYIEEPLKNPAKHEELYNKTKISIALDESLLKWNFNTFQSSLLSMNWVYALILKPSLLGGLDKTMRYIDLSERMNKISVISDTFHSGIGISLLACFAAAKLKRKTAVGLNTYHWLAKDLLKQRLSFNRGICNISTIYIKSKNVKMSVLEKIDI